ncbi:MAG: D-aminoacyl-tRNA deacylase [Kiritimatiellia bacterium]
MKAFIQRVAEAQVTIEGVRVAAIGRGFLVLLGVTHGDTEAMADRLADRTVKLRIFEDEDGKTNRSVVDVAGSIIVVSQFTLYADTRHGNRPGFSKAARPDLAVPLYTRYVARLRERLGADRVGTGRFGAHMAVSLVNDGPFSVELAEPSGSVAG